MSEIRNRIIKEMVDIISGKKYVPGSSFDEYELALSLLGINGLAVVDRKAELPMYKAGRAVDTWIAVWRVCYRLAQEDMLKAGWVKEVK